MTIQVDQIIERMKWAARNGLCEYSGKAGDCRVTIALMSAAPVAAVSAPSAAAEAAESPAAHDALKAPLAGLCHLCPEAGGQPFVKPGDRVEAGQTLCIIEAMKMMTSIPAEAAGTVQEIIVQDGAAVAAGQPLMRIA